MLKAQSKRNAGNKIYSVVGWFCYIACTIISAILNIYLLSKLDQSWAWFLLTMSLSLEFGKAYILIRANTYRSLVEYLKNCKFKASKVLTKERLFYSLYVLFAVLSITASLCFSLTITDKTEQGFSLQKQEINQNLETISKSQIKYEETLEKFTMLQDNSDAAAKSAKENLRKAEDFNKQMDEATERLAEKIAAEKDISKSEAYRTIEYRSSKEKSSYDKSKVDLSRAKEDYEDVISGKTLERAKKAYEAAEAEFNEKVKLYGSLESLKLALSTIDKQELEMAGSSKCFILLANTFGMPDKVKTIKFIILLYVSLLVELCIWLSSPDLRLDGGLLYSYRNDLGLSTKKDVDKLLKEIKDTNARFSVKEEEVKIVEKIPVKTLKELDNLKEQVELLSREKEESEAIVKDLHMQYSDQIDKLNNKISADQNSFEEDSEEKLKVINDMEDNYRKLEEEMNSKIEKLQAELEEAQSESEEIAHSNNDKVDYIKDLDEKIKLLEDERNYYQGEFNSLKEESDDMKESTKYLINKNKELEGKISSLNEKLVEKSANDINKYSEDDIKDVVKKTAEKSKKEIRILKEQVASWEEAYNKISEENNNLKLANSSLENNNQNLLKKNEELNSKEEEQPKKTLKEIKVGTLEDEIKELLK